MPIVKHICVRYNAKRTLRYVLDPDKTDDLLWATSINCMTEPDLAYTQMAAVYEQFARDYFNSPPPIVGNGTVKVIHYIQSFSPDDDVTPELAHKIAKAFLRKAFGDDVQAVIATHVDKDHLHSHIIINSYSLSGKKYYANRKSLKRIREISDGVCKAYGIDIHPNLTGKGKSIKHKEWEHRKNGTSWKEQIKQEISCLLPILSVQRYEYLFSFGLNLSPSFKTLPFGSFLLCIVITPFVDAEKNPMYIIAHIRLFYKCR